MRERLLISVNATARSLASLRCHGNTPSTPLNAAGRREREREKWKSESFTAYSKERLLQWKRGGGGERERTDKGRTLHKWEIYHTHTLSFASVGVRGARVSSAVWTRRSQTSDCIQLFICQAESVVPASHLTDGTAAPHIIKKRKKKPQTLITSLMQCRRVTQVKKLCILLACVSVCTRCPALPSFNHMFIQSSNHMCEY